MENIEKLPKWAQGHIARLENRLKTVQADLDARDAKTKTRIYYDEGYGQNERRHYLTNDERICFFTGKGAHDRGEFEVYLRGDAIEVYCRTNSLEVSPVSSNVIRIKEGRD
jgi:hypothetical protein